MKPALRHFDAPPFPAMQALLRFHNVDFGGKVHGPILTLGRLRLRLKAMQPCDSWLALCHVPSTLKITRSDLRSSMLSQQNSCARWH